MPDIAPASFYEASFDDFLKIDIRVGKIMLVETLPKSKKLLKLQVDFGTFGGVRTILAGIAEHYLPESLLGLNVAAVVNLAPRTMFGIESHGMLLAGHNGDKVCLVTCPDVAVGERLG